LGAEKLQGSEDLHSRTPQAEARQNALSTLGLALLAFASRAVGLGNGLVFDDYFTIAHRGAAPWIEVLRGFVTDRSQMFGSNFYRPVLIFWDELVFRVFGREAWGWHLASILLHVLCTLLVFRVANAVLRKRSVAWVAAALFAVHPAHVEAVAWASAMGDLLMAAFLLLSAVALLEWKKSGRTIWYAASLLAAACCLGSKEPGVMLPVVLAACVWASPAGKAKKIAVPLVPFFALSVVFLIVRRMVLPAFSHHLNPSTSGSMAATWPAALLFYLQHMFWPPVVVPFYPVQIVQSWQSSGFFLPLLIVAAVVAVLGYLLRRAAGARGVCFCVAWFALLAPALYLKVFAPYELVHDRFLYAPLIGFCMALTVILRWATAGIEARTGSNVYLLVSIALMAAWGFQTMNETVWWRNNLTIFTHNVAYAPDNPKALVKLGDAYVEARRYDDAVPLFQRALAHDPQSANAMFGLGMMAWRVGDDEQAESYLAQALRIDPRYDEWAFLARAELHRKKFDAAEQAARQAVALSSTGLGAHLVLGQVLDARGDRVGAVREFQEELRFNPENEEARAALARVTNAGN
jgi:tetratricopeptide (TPR) repeat protein